MRNRTENQIAELIFLRHGATSANKEGRYLGTSDAGLSKEGIQALQSRKVAGYYPEADLLFSSPMKRCQETCEILYQEQEPVLIPQWTEMDFGEFEGKNYQELNGDPGYQAWIDSNGTLPFPGGESREAFIQRCMEGWAEMKRVVQSRMAQRRMAQEGSGAKWCKKQKSTEDVRIVCVVHGGTIMALLSGLTHTEYYDYQCKNGHGYRCRWKIGQNTVEQIQELTSTEQISMEQIEEVSHREQRAGERSRKR